MEGENSEKIFRPILCPYFHFSEERQISWYSYVTHCTCYCQKIYKMKKRKKRGKNFYVKRYSQVSYQERFHIPREGSLHNYNRSMNQECNLQ
jgi:hypothetical protein